MRRSRFHPFFVALSALVLALPLALTVTGPVAGAAAPGSPSPSGSLASTGATAGAGPGSAVALRADSARPGAISPAPPSTSSLGQAAPGARAATSSVTPAAAATYTFGQQPLADVVSSSANVDRCAGLTTNMLAAIVLAPTYPETGASGSLSPSPMTLSRSDTGAGLYDGGNPSTPYPRAFWNPGIGPWQFDSAGAWPLSTAQEMSTDTASAQAASAMASRYCANIGSGAAAARQAAWGPWACTHTPSCESIYQTIYTPGSGADGTLNVHTDASVTRTGGMVATTCTAVTGASVPCWFINPAAAQGDNAFTVPGFGPAPLSAPFYDYVLAGNEYRVWSSNDTGYPQTIYAELTVGLNARTSITWGTNGSPFGNLEKVTTGPGEVQVSGWAIDPDTSTPITMQPIIDGAYPPQFAANANRPDVGAAYPASGPDHGFSQTFTEAPGSHQVCVWALNDTTGPNTLMGCRTVSVGGSPFGNFESVVAGPDQIEVNGWAIDPDLVTPVGMVLYVDGVYVAPFSAGGTRSDIGAAFPLYGPAHGFSTLFNASAGTHSVCIWAVNTGAGSNTMLGCRTVTVGGSPFGNFESIVPTAGAARVSGWAIDPDTSSAAQMVLYLDGAWHGQLAASAVRADVGGAFPLYGVGHGFSQAVVLSSGSHTICMWVLDVGAGSNTMIGCRSVVVPSS